jgi:phosphoacetylglucosamine mutase
LIDETYKNQIECLNKHDNDFNKLIQSNKALKSLYILKNLKDCINQTVGDAITDLLVVELILAMKQLSIVDWDLLYTDLPSRQLKVTIKDRNLIRTTDAERRVAEPIQLQNEIDLLIKNLGYKMARSFVRPSGTEDVVRVYAEADTQENTDNLANKVSQLVFDLAGGVGKRP